MTDTHLGLIVVAVPALIIGLVMLGRYKPVLWMYIGAMAIGLGYLTVQGTIADIGRETRSYLPTEKAAEPMVAPEPAPATAPVPEPTPPPAAPEPATPPPSEPVPDTTVDKLPDAPVQPSAPVPEPTTP